MLYDELLNQKEWWQKRNEILNRDHYRCKDCGCLGFHNGYNYMKVNQIEEIDAMLKEWTFNGMEFSKFWADIPNRKPHPCKDIKFEKQHENDGIFVYELMLNETVKPFGICEYPLEVAVSNEIIDTLNATVYKYRISKKKNDSSESSGRVHLFEFPCAISNDIYVDIEYSSIPMVPDQTPYETVVFNITSGNRLFTLVYLHDSFPLKGLNVHHTYYTKGCKPWEYENDSLVTLCEDCHKKRHESSRIPIYDHNKKLIDNLIPCDRCGGSGYLPQYSHVEHGICFKCYGEGVVIT